jgi:hypothetical protein
MMDTMTMRRHKCPYCFHEFKTIEWSDDVDFTCLGCDHVFTLGEARRGRPDPAPSPDLVALRAELVEVADDITKAVALERVGLGLGWEWRDRIRDVAEKLA